MGNEQWKKDISNFERIDVRQLQGNFFPGLQKRAVGLSKGSGLTIIQTFEPLPLYAPMEAMDLNILQNKWGKMSFIFISPRAGD